MKKKSNSLVNKDPVKLHYISKHGIIVYPVSEMEYSVRRGFRIESKFWFIEVNNNGKIKTFPKKILSQDIEDSAWKTINYYYELLTKKE